MNKILIVILLFSVSFSFSQVIITQADMPNAGDTLRVSYSNDALDPLQIDTNCLLDDAPNHWHYEYLTPASQWLHKFDNPSTFVFPFNLLFNPLNTSYGQAQYTPDSIPVIGIAPDDSYFFLKESSSKFRQIGAGLTINSLPLPFVYNPHDTIYRFPLTCGDRDSSYAEYGLNIPGIGYYGQSITRVNYADGYGTLYTPFGSFMTLRVQSQVTLRDTFSDTSGTFGFAFNRPLKYEYKWLKNGGKIPYLFVTANDVAGVPVVSNIEYRDSMRSVTQIGVGELNTQTFQFIVYPNPASDYVFVEYDLESGADVLFEVYDVTARNIFNLERKKQKPGKNMEFINISGIQKGIYFLRMKAGGKEGTGKIVVR